MVSRLGKRCIVICFGLLMALLGFLVGFKIADQQRGEVSYKDYFGSEIVTQKTVLQALTDLRTGQHDRGIRTLEIQLCVTTAFLPHWLEEAGEAPDDYSALTDTMTQVRRYFEDYDVYGRAEGLPSYKAARRTVEEFLTQ